MLIPYEQLFIQAHFQQKQLITEQNPGEHNPLIQLSIDTTSISRDYRSIPRTSLLSYCKSHTLSDSIQQPQSPANFHGMYAINNFIYIYFKFFYYNTLHFLLQATFYVQL
jgi:hypothetical protein